MADLLTDSGKDLGKEDIIELLGEDDNLTEEEGKEKVKTDTEGVSEKDTKDKLDLLTDDDDKDEDKDKKDKKDTDDDLDELITPANRQAIIKAYPDLFTKFPFIEVALKRNKEYSELFPTVQDAEETLEKSKTYEQFESDLLSGSIESTLKSVKEADGDSFTKMVNEFMPTIAKVDKEAYHHILGDIIRRSINTAFNSGTQMGDTEEGKNLKIAAQILNKFMFGTPNLAQPSKFGGEKPESVNAEELKLKEEKAAFIQEKFESVESDLGTKIHNVLSNTIEANIDPRGSMSAYVKRNAVRDVISKLEDLIGEDKGFQRIKQRLWDSSFDENFSKGSLEKIRSTYLGKAKTLLPALIKQVRAEAISGQNLASAKKEQKQEPTRERRERSDKGSNREPDRPEKKMSTLDYLMQD